MIQTLLPDQYLRYSRHIILPEIGLKGQKKLLDSRVLIVGMGGLGCPVAQYLAAAGVGTLGLMDFDKVDESNLQRQLLYTQNDIGRPKVDVACERLRALNPDVNIRTYSVRLTSENAREILSEYDVLIDGTDNFPTRYLLNDASVILNKPFIYASIYRFEGQVMTFKKGEGPCYRCLFPEPPPPSLIPTCAEGGVLAVLPGIIGTIQATETIKLLVGTGEPLVGRLLLFDALSMSFRQVQLQPSEQCPVCGPNASIKELIDYEEFCGIAPSVFDEAVDQLSPQEVNSRLQHTPDIILLDVREPFEFDLVHIPNAIHIPLSELILRFSELEPYKHREIYVYCHKGGRSLTAVSILKARGFSCVKNIVGGIDQWAEEVDPSMPRY